MKKTLKLLLITLISSTLLFATNHTVNTQGMNFSPSILTINSGDTVTFINTGGSHNVNGSISTFPSNPVGFSNPTGVSSSWVYSFVFNLPGTYSYQCDPHLPGMVGSIVVNSVSNTVYDIVAGSNNHTTLKTALDLSGLDAVLSGTGPFTLFAPTNAAFNTLPAGALSALLNNIPQLWDVLIGHVVTDSVMSNMLSNGQVVTTLLGTDITVTINSTGVYIDNAMVTVADLVADNGVVHVIDAVLLSTTDCNGITNGTALIDTCGTCHQAYIYNFISHQFTFVDNANTLIPGVDYDPSTETVVFADDPMNPFWNDCGGNTVYDIVSGSIDHTTLKTAIDACSLDGVLSDPGPFTLFAPTDAAFNLLPAGTVTALLNNIPQLTDILTHHVVADSIMSTMLSNGQVVTTLLGTDITVTINSTGVYIDNAMVTVADLVADNGVVHVIDAVLLPISTSVDESVVLTKPEFLYSINILGEKVHKYVKNQIVFDVYGNGDIVRRFVR